MMTAKTRPPLALTQHQRILGDIEGRIMSGEWPPGHRLPFEVDLAQTFGVSRMTVNKVLSQLAATGLIERRKRFGSIVARPQAQSAVLEIHDIEAEVCSRQQAYGFVVKTLSVRKARLQEAASLGVDATAEVVAVTCLHLADDAPFCLEERIINLEAVPQARAVRFDTQSPGKWLQAQVPWTAAEHTILAVGAEGDAARQLAVMKQSPCLVIQRKTWGGNGPVTLARFTYPADKHVFVARFTPATAQHL